MARRLSVNRTSVYNWIQEDPDFAEAMHEANESLLDLAESQNRRLIAGVPIIDKAGKFIGWETPPSIPNIIFTLKTKGKERGYVERIEQTGKNGKDLIPSVPFELVDPAKPNEIIDFDIDE